jgi:uncharacterized protein with PIN domain
MRHIEMHVIETVSDLSLAELAGLDVFPDDRCEKCSELIADLDHGKFRPFIALLDDESEWFVCTTCAAGIL